MFDPLAEVFDHVLVLHPLDIDVLWRWKRISVEKHGTEPKVNEAFAHIGTDSIGAFRYLWKSIVQR